ncbi:MAG: M50 family metallopeptidase [Patescibacteria group bacterium]|nr:M50 family metallopeptidase [Patescibacteria group bacterium]
MDSNILDKLYFFKTIDYGSMPAKFALMLAFILLASFLIDFFLSRSIFGRGYRIFVAPGIIVHEFSHALMCLLTGAKVSKISLFEKEGGKVVHSSPKIPILGQILISLAPIAFGAGAIFLLSKKLGINDVDFAAIHLTKQGLLEFIRSTFSNLDFHKTSTWIIVYLVLSIAVTLTPSFQDLRNVALSIGLIIIGILLVYRFSAFRLDFNLLIPDQIIILLSTVSLLLILGLLLSIILYIISRLFKPA